MNLDMMKILIQRLAKEQFYKMISILLMVHRNTEFMDSVFKTIVDRHIKVPELTPKILREFVYHIAVHVRSGTYKNKFYTRKVSVFFNYFGEIQ